MNYHLRLLVYNDPLTGNNKLFYANLNGGPEQEGKEQVPVNMTKKTKNITNKFDSPATAKVANVRT